VSDSVAIDHQALDDFWATPSADRHRPTPLPARRQESDLREALKTTKSSDVRQRVGSILDSLRPDAAQALREDRALAALELIATPTAKQTLESLASGAPAARRTRLARRCSSA
jgi:hypothetical protein